MTFLRGAKDDSNGVRRRWGSGKRPGIPWKCLGQPGLRSGVVFGELWERWLRVPLRLREPRLGAGYHPSQVIKSIN